MGNTVYKYALDCEMIGDTYNRSMLASVSIVDEYGKLVYNKYVKPTASVGSWRFIRDDRIRQKILNGHDFDTVRREVAELLKNNILIGHSLHFDLSALSLDHPQEKCRDLAKYFQLNGQPISLKTLAANHLNRYIQWGDHNSEEDSKATMDIYLKFADKWENSLKHSWKFHDIWMIYVFFLCALFHCLFYLVTKQPL